MDLGSPLTEIKGVGEKTVALFAGAGILTVRDLLDYFPRAYEDFSGCRAISEVQPGKVIVRAKVENAKLRRVRRGLTIVEASLVDETGAVRAVWFNQPYRMTQFKEGREYYLAGEFELSYGRYALMNPATELASDVGVGADKVVAVYRAAGRLKSRDIGRVVEKVRGLCGGIEESLPEEVRGDLMRKGEAIYQMHFAESQEELARARERLGFEEMFGLILAGRLNKIENQKLRAVRVEFEQERVKEFVGKLPYKLTGAQRRAAWEIIQDMERTTPMNRLLQGDVGSGKTVVAGLAAYQVYLAGGQTAVMAPTEILAGQHAETLSEMLGGFGVKVGLLTGKTKNRKVLLEKIAAGEVDVVVGTHALISEGVRYRKLVLAVVDEQHRFGVKQRQKLVEKVESSTNGAPHFLAMTATPIPRSLQLTLFGELDISVLDELPKGRKKIETKLISPNSLDEMWRKVREELERGRQIYYVCSQIEEGEEDEKRAVKREFERLKKMFAGRSVGLLHGRMKTEEKEGVMEEFLAGKIDVLVATTVVEVGVNVPNATVMIVRDADRFGLSQLHQLRGRVGRSEHQSYCYLVNSTSAKPTRRLREIEKSTDGFYLAEKDLEIRGPGEVYGTSQHGELDLKIASIGDVKLLRRANKAVDGFLKSGTNLVDYRELAEAVRKYQRLTTLN